MAIANFNDAAYQRPSREDLHPLHWGAVDFKNEKINHDTLMLCNVLKNPLLLTQTIAIVIRNSDLSKCLRENGEQMKIEKLNKKNSKNSWVKRKETNNYFAVFWKEKQLSPARVARNKVCGRSMTSQLKISKEFH